MNRLPFPTNTEVHISDWRTYCKFWHVLFPGARSESVTAKPRKAVKCEK